MELFGHILNTGVGKIVALDGCGTIDIDNYTGYDLIIKGLDTGIGSPGVVIITDTSKKKAGRRMFIWLPSMSVKEIKLS